MQELTTHIIVLAIFFLTQERDNATIRDASGDNRHLIHVMDIWRNRRHIETVGFARSSFPKGRLFAQVPGKCLGRLPFLAL